MSETVRDGPCDSDSDYRRGEICGDRKPVNGWYPVNVDGIEGWGIREICGAGDGLFLRGDKRRRGRAYPEGSADP